MADNFRVSLSANKRVVLAAAGLLEGERYLLRYVIIGECGKEIGVIDYQPNCCPVYLGICDGKQNNTGNPVQISTFPNEDIIGTYELVPDGVVSPNAKIYAKFISESV